MQKDRKSESLFTFLAREMLGLKADATLVPVFPAKEVKQIKVTDKPLPQIKKAEDISIVDIQSFEEKEARKRGIEKFNFTFNLFLPKYVSLNYWEFTKSASDISKLKLPQEIYSRLNTLSTGFEGLLNGVDRPDLVICDMGTVGKGVFTPEKMGCGEVITFLGGELVPPLSERKFTELDKIYGLLSETDAPLFTQVVASTNGKITPLNQYGINSFGVVGRKYSNYDWFFQHLPDEKSLDRYGIPKVYHQYLATDNLKFVKFLYKNLYPIAFFTARRDIAAGEQLGWDHRDEYWRNKSPFTLFNRRGEPVGRIKDEKVEEKESLQKKILLIELGNLSTRFNPQGADGWKYHKTRLSAFLVGKKLDLDVIADDLTKKDIDYKLIKVRESDDYTLLVNENQCSKLIKLAESEILMPAFQ